MVVFRSLEEIDRDHGTVKLLDASHRYKSKEKTDIVLIPQPTDDPNDPLNWSPSAKTGAMIAAAMMCLLPSWILGGAASGIPMIIKAFGSNLHEVVDILLTWPTLLFGLGVFFWVPIVLYIGARPVGLLGSLIVFVTSFWSAGAHSIASLEASRIVSGWAMCCGEILPPIIVRDIFFLHERGSRMAIYVMFLQAVPAIGNVISGFLITHAGWRWHFWLTGIVGAVVFVFIFFLLPETQYYRPSEAQAPLSRSSTSENEATPPNQKDSMSVEHAQPVTPPVKKSALQRLKPWSGLNPGGHETAFLSLVVRPWPLVLYPAVIYSTLNFAIGIAVVLCYLDTAPAVFQSPPYNMSPGVQSLIVIPYMIGGVLGSIVGGLGTDLYCRYKARKSNGVFEPENRLIMVFFPALVTSAGVFMYGWGIAKHYPWPLSWIGGAFIAFGHCAIPTITMAYAVDCYYPVAPEALQLIVGLKQVLGFGFSYAVTPWVASWGYKRVFGTMAALYLGIAMLGLPLYIYGKRLRYASAKWKAIIW